MPPSLGETMKPPIVDLLSGHSPAKGPHPAASLSHSLLHPHSARHRRMWVSGIMCSSRSRWEQETHRDGFGAGFKRRLTGAEQLAPGVSGSRLNLGPQGQGQRGCGAWWDRPGRLPARPARLEEVPLTFKGRGRAPVPAGASRGWDRKPRSLEADVCRGGAQSTPRQ